VKNFMGVLCQTAMGLAALGTHDDGKDCNKLRLAWGGLLWGGRFYDAENSLDRQAFLTWIAGGNETRKESLYGNFQWWYHPPVSQHIREKRKETS
jgi:hypothetical protein